MRCAAVAAALACLAGCRPGPSAPDHPGRKEPASPVDVEPFAMGRPDVLLLVTGGTNGRLEVCSCCGVMPGGLSRRSGLAASYRAVCDRTVLIDTGDAFWIHPGDVINDFVAEGLRMAPYDVVVLGDQEWAAGPARLKALLSAAEPSRDGGTPGAPPTEYLSTTVRARDPSAGPSVSHVVRRQWGRLKIAFLADARADWTLTPSTGSREVVFDPPDVVRDQARRLKAEGFLVVLTVHGDDQAAVRAATDCPVDLVLRGHTSKTDPNLLRAAGRPMVKVGGGDWVGVVAMKVSGGRLAALEYRAEALGERWPIDERMVSLYQAYTHAAARQSLDAGRATPLAYASSAECGRCHRRQYEFWKGTAHARAYEGLRRDSRQDDRNCLMCHTSGMMTAGGFESVQKTPHLANVNCQDCHRLTIQEHHGGQRKPPRVSLDTCVVCHMPLTDPSFELDPQARLRDVTCPKGK